MTNPCRDGRYLDICNTYRFNFEHPEQMAFIIPKKLKYPEYFDCNLNGRRWIDRKDQQFQAKLLLVQKFGGRQISFTEEKLNGKKLCRHFLLRGTHCLPKRGMKQGKLGWCWGRLERKLRLSSRGSVKWFSSNSHWIEVI